MELRHLRTFVVAAEMLHFARAAEALGVAPPTLTQQVQEIERNLGAKLFTRARRAVALTPAGAVFLTEARAVLARFDRAESVGRRAGRGEIGRIELGYVGSAAYNGTLQSELSRFRSSRPEVEIHARELAMPEIAGAVADGSLDVGFVRLPMDLPSNLGRHILARDNFCVALCANHPLAGLAAAVDPRTIACEAFIAPEQGSGLDEVARRGDFRPNVVASPGSLVAVVTQVSLGAGVSVIPDVVRSAIHIPNVVFLQLTGDPIQSEVAAIFRTRDPSAAVQTFVRQMRRQGRRLRSRPQGDA